MRPAIIILIAALAALPACTKAPPPTTTGAVADPPCAPFSEPVFHAGAGFDGENALGHVLKLACDFSGPAPRALYRVPGTPEREAAARYIANTLEEAHASVEWQNFTGAEYQAMAKGVVAPYAASGSSHCDEAEYARVTALRFQNVIGTFGTGPKELVFLAHYESQRTSTEDKDPVNRTLPDLGANDGLSGVGVLLESARVLSQHSPSMKIRLLLDDGEDGFDDCHPLAGAIYFARHLAPSERDSIKGVFLLDMVGAKVPHFCYDTTTSDLTVETVQAAQRAEAPLLSSASACRYGIYDDHSAFIDVGIPAIDIVDYAQGFPPDWDKRSDTPDKLSADTLAQVGRTVIEIAHGAE